MKCLIFFALVACALAHKQFTPQELSNNVWVVLAAGSDGWGNYRHQADVCHNYQVAHSMGIPDEHIIVFMKDDLAQNPSNPRKGVIINEPGGPDVYHGVPKDYTGRDVSSANFLKVLEGTNPGVGSGKVLKSGPQDYVFVFFDDHGTHGALCWPEGCSLTGPKFEATMQVMYSKKMYKELVIYIEACYAGSVFVNQKIPPNVYITTASPPGASSFAYNYDSTIRAYVADIYSWLFIHDLEVNPLTRTFNDQFDYMQDNIQNYSMVCQYGDKDYGKVRLDAFWKGTGNRKMSDRKVKITDAVPAWDVPYEMARREVEANPTTESIAAFKAEVELRDRVNEMGERILDSMGVAKHLTLPPCTTCTSACKCIQYCGSSEYCKSQCCDQQGCYRTSNEAEELCTQMIVGRYLEKCGNEHPYLRSIDGKIARACQGKGAKLWSAFNVIDEVCKA